MSVLGRSFGLWLSVAASVGGCAALRRAPIATTQEACSSLPLLAHLERDGRARRVGRLGIHVDWVADLHSEDCGAPDCFGTELGLDLTLRPEGARCFVDKAVVRTREYVRCKSSDDMEGQISTEEFEVDGQIDLSSSGSDRLLLRSAAGDRALIVRPTRTFWFESLIPGRPLRESMPSDEKRSDDCCWATEMSAEIKLPR